MRREVARVRIAWVEGVEFPAPGPLDDEDGPGATLVFPIGPVMHDASRVEAVELDPRTAPRQGQLMAPLIVVRMSVQDQVDLFAQQEIQNIRSGLTSVLSGADAVLV